MCVCDVRATENRERGLRVSMDVTGMISVCVCVCVSLCACVCTRATENRERGM